MRGIARIAESAVIARNRKSKTYHGGAEKRFCAGPERVVFPSQQGRRFATLVSFLRRSATLRAGLPAVTKDFFFLLPSTYPSAREARLGDVLGYPLVAPSGAWLIGAIAVPQLTAFHLDE